MSPPIIFLIFNRPKLTRRVFACIRAARPERFFIAADGPRADRPGEAQLCDEARSVIDGVDWPCAVKTLFREKNLGCRVAVSTAIDWFFDHEPEGIILEDDCVPDATFFPYAKELLIHYRNDERVMVIAGDHFHGDAHQPPHSYFLSRYPHCWGWASWRRAWQHYDHDMSQWPALRNTDWLLTVGDGNRDFQRYWTRIFDMAYAGKVDSWAYRWTFSCWAQSGLTILPALNLVTNIGFSEDATRTKGSDEQLDSIPIESLSFPLSHLSSMVRDYAADHWTDQHVFKQMSVSFVMKIMLRLRRSLGKYVKLTGRFCQ